jgi:aldose 1-epimerase
MPGQHPTPFRTARRRSLLVVLGAGLLVGGLASPAGATDDAEEEAGPSTSVEPFGQTPDGTDVERWTLTNGDATMRVLTFGGVIQTFEVPDAAGEVENVVLGYPTSRATTRRATPTSAR